MFYDFFRFPETLPEALTDLAILLGFLVFGWWIFFAKQRKLRNLGRSVGMNREGKISTVDFEGCRVDDKALRQIQGLVHLEKLWLNETNITDDQLARLKGLTSLKELGLFDTAITDAGLKHLESLTSLKDLVLEATKVTEKGISEFKAAVPDCRIRHPGFG